MYFLCTASPLQNYIRFARTGRNKDVSKNFSLHPLVCERHIYKLYRYTPRRGNSLGSSCSTTYSCFALKSAWLRIAYQNHPPRQPQEKTLSDCKGLSHNHPQQYRHSHFIFSSTPHIAPSLQWRTTTHSITTSTWGGRHPPITTLRLNNYRPSTCPRLTCPSPTCWRCNSSSSSGRTHTCRCSTLATISPRLSHICRTS